ncbi:dihydrolipoamide acetyltransferase family protein [Euzebya tangerina]|uniref:dihydrolipoamide acetyltransferase family protein n=1 Tax=Euzebya tangerina TaxID=591198 RepID=UPI0013C2A5E0|nr:dihydrolipoamide acetyltransferase family protein [Euzebya tangerina]
MAEDGSPDGLVRVAVDLPHVGEAIAEATLVEWRVDVGDHVTKGEVMFEVDVDKAVVEIESFVDGVVLELLVERDTFVMPGQRIAVVGVAPDGVPLDAEVLAEPDEDAGPDEDAQPAAVGAGAGGSASRADRDAAQTTGSRHAGGGRPTVSPRARRLAADRDIDLSQVAGSGPGGVVTEDDVARHASVDGAVAAALPPEETDGSPLGDHRQRVADATTRSKQEVPHFYLDVEVDATPLEAHRAQQPERPSVTAYVVAACAQALRDAPEHDAHYRRGRLISHATPRIGVAVAAESGLAVPIVVDPPADVGALAGALHDATARARSQRLNAEDFGERSLVVSNLGMFGIDRVLPIISQPDPYILGVGRITDQAVVADGQVVPGRRLILTLSVDHRAQDGAAASAFLAAVARLLETPEAWTR